MMANKGLGIMRQATNDLQASANYFGDGESLCDRNPQRFRKALSDAVSRTLPGSALYSARDIQMEMAAWLEADGFEVRTEVATPHRGDGRRGRIDIVFASNGDECAVEIDRRLPRIKSIAKIRAYKPYCGFVVTRSDGLITEVSP